jgi:N-acetyl-anhydromuramyl-L-alanine amidase AmpD
MPSPPEQGRIAGEIIKSQPPVTRKIPLATNQYYQGVFPKKYIFLHHTAGGSAAGAIAGWAADPLHIATPYIIERTGDIYEVYDPKYWAYSLGVKGNTAIEKAAIPIEIVSYGNLTVATADNPAKKVRKGDFVSYTGRPISPAEVVQLNFRGFKYYQKYTDAQIRALSELLPYLMDRFKIAPQTDLNGFWEYRSPATLTPGIWSHTTVRKDKVDIFPQKELIDLVYGL